jgi:predicted subunit of tRNA(5-methylaminomethyl-2-thiouridylate) methyltransferase
MTVQLALEVQQGDRFCLFRPSGPQGLRLSAMVLDRLPWETWEIAREFGVVPEIRIARSPMNLPAERVFVNGY